MGKRNLLPEAKFEAFKDIALPMALDKWNPSIKASDDTDNTISIMDPIGYDWWTDSGVTAKRISAALRSMNGADVIVNINSPGGDVFEGLTIYNLLREYEGKVTVRILGLAASAASFIAMAADEIQIARAGFFMIHNAWTGVWGNRNDMREIADFLEQIDDTLADIYNIRSGVEFDEIKSMMDKESWINGKNAVDQGFADSFLDSDISLDDDIANKKQGTIAAHKLDLALAKVGMPRAERRNLLKEFKGKQNATNDATQDAGLDLSDLVSNMQNAVEKFKS